MEVTATNGNQLFEIVLFPIDGEVDPAMAAQHAAGAAPQRHPIPARRTDGVVLADLDGAGHVPGTWHDRPFSRRRIRHLEESAYDGNRFASYIYQGGESIGLDEPVPGAAAQVAVEVSL